MSEVSLLNLMFYVTLMNIDYRQRGLPRWLSQDLILCTPGGSANTYCLLFNCSVRSDSSATPLDSSPPGSPAHGISQARTATTYLLRCLAVSSPVLGILKAKELGRAEILSHMTSGPTAPKVGLNYILIMLN